MPRLHPLSFDTKGLTVEQLESFGTGLIDIQKGLYWWIGDAARYAKDVLHLGDNYSQIFPANTSPGLIARCEAVARAYPKQEDRNPDASWTVHMREANQPDRIERVKAHVEAGRTTDEVQQHKANSDDDRPRWLLAFDVHYFLHRHYYSGAGVESAMQVSEWITRTVERLREKGCTDVACAFEGGDSVRKELTSGPEWEEQRYKDRPPRPHDLQQQLELVRELLEKAGYCCVHVNGYEADDVLASYAAQFPGKTTIVTSDKDLRQVLGGTTNILLGVEWTEDESTGEHMPEYQWLTAKGHFEETGVRPDEWTEYQCIMGDNVDGIKGVPGIGSKGATDLIREFSTVDAVIQAAKDDDPRIPEKKRAALIEFEPRLEVTRQLVTLRTDLTMPMHTRI